MLLKTYGIFDSIQGEYVRTFSAQNDDDAKRAAQYVVKEQGFDDIAGKDRSIHFLYTLDTANGQIVENSVHPICNLATFIEERKQEEIQKKLQEKLASEEFVKVIKSDLLIYLKGELKDVLSEGNSSK